MGRHEQAPCGKSSLVLVSIRYISHKLLCYYVSPWKYLLTHSTDTRQSRAIGMAWQASQSTLPGLALQATPGIHDGKTMIFCSCCGKQLHESAPTCPHCGGVQRRQASAPVKGEGPVWLAIVALVSGIICVLALLSDEPMDEETVLGLFLFSLTGMIVGAISIKKYIAGKKMAIAAVVLSSISFLALIGMLQA